MKKLIIVFACLLSAGLVLAATTPTETFTPTATETGTVTSTFTFTATFTVTPTTTETIVASETMTSTITDTITPTFTITPTSTITPTFTVTPTPQSKAFAFPNPAKNTNEIGFAYPIEAGKSAQLVTIIIKAVNGEEAGRAYDPTPNGYTYVDISKYARGIYLYQMIIRYTDGTEKKFPLDKFGKFAVIK